MGEDFSWELNLNFKYLSWFRKKHHPNSGHASDGLRRQEWQVLMPSKWSSEEPLLKSWPFDSLLRFTFRLEEASHSRKCADERSVAKYLESGTLRKDSTK